MALDKRFYLSFLPFLMLVIGMFPSCFKQEPSSPNPPPIPQTAPQLTPEPEPAPLPPAPEEPDVVSAPTPWMSPLALIKSGENPLWFELGSERTGVPGPFLIATPEEASLTPFEPWPLARHITGMVFQEDRLVMAMNREGFLIALPWNTKDTALYRIADPGAWDNYTIGSLFLFEGNPAALLYRDDFFVDPVSAPPSHQVFAPLKGSAQPVGIKVPAFAPFLLSEGWELETLKEGRDGYWYYRVIQRLDRSAKPSYFRTSDLSLPGEPVSRSAFRNAALPLALDQAPPVLALVLDKVFTLNGPDRIPVAAIISPQFPYTRSFARGTSFSGAQDQLVELCGYYLPSDSGGQALAILPDGRGMIGQAQGNELNVKAITLPPLPEGFSYTGIGLSGQTLIASWEEQQDMNVGAAGLMIIRLP